MSYWRYIADPKYEEISTITRCLHLKKAMDSYFRQRLFPHKIVSSTVDLDVEVLGFAPTRPMTENNMYGNVSFTLDWKTALEQLGPYLYFIDQQENSISYYGSVLLTYKKYEFLTPVDDGGHGMPMWLFNNKYYAATASEGVQYVLEIGVEVNRRRENWVFQNCKIEPNDHSSANTLLYKGGPYNPCICHKFNYFNSECPSPYKLNETKMILEVRCPTMLRNNPAGKPAPSSVKRKRTKKKVAAAAAARKPVVVVNDESYDDYYYDDDYYYEEREPIYNAPSTPKKEEEGLFTFGNVVTGVIMVAIGWYLWRK